MMMYRDFLENAGITSDIQGQNGVDWSPRKRVRGNAAAGGARPWGNGKKIDASVDTTPPRRLMGDEAPSLQRGQRVLGKLRKGWI